MAPTRRPDSPPVATIDASPAYEMLASIVTTFDTGQADTYEVGAPWIDAARARAGDDLLLRMSEVSHGDSDVFIHLFGLAHDTPAPRDVPAFIEHLRQTDADDIRLHLVQYYSRDARRCTPAAVIRAAIAGEADAKADFLRTSYPEWEPWTTFLRFVLDTDGETLKTELIAVLELWAERVWRPESVSIMPIVERDAEAKRELLRDLPIDRFITTATNGVEFVPHPGIERVIMIPSFLARPLVSYVDLGDTLLIVYPVADDSVSADADAPPPRLVRLSKALGDEKRLRILRVLAEGDRTLMELADQFGVAKTTMHHHMIVLRSAGLVSVGVGQKRYRLRTDAVPDLGSLLSGYLEPRASTTAPAPGRQRRRRTGTEG